MSVVYREACCSCKKVQDVKINTMWECVSCKQLLCIGCACCEGDTKLFIEATGKGKILEGNEDEDMNGHCGWVCPACFENQFGRAPKKVIWTDSPSSGEKQKPIEDPIF